MHLKPLQLLLHVPFLIKFTQTFQQFLNALLQQSLRRIKSGYQLLEIHSSAASNTSICELCFLQFLELLFQISQLVTYYNSTVIKFLCDLILPQFDLVIMDCKSTKQQTQGQKNSATPQKRPSLESNLNKQNLPDIDSVCCHYFKELEQAIQQTKLKVKKILNHEHSILPRSFLRETEKKFELLKSDRNDLLNKEGILTLYLDISQNYNHYQQESLERYLLSRLLEPVEVLLKYFLAYKQYLASQKSCKEAHSRKLLNKSSVSISFNLESLELNRKRSKTRQSRSSFQEVDEAKIMANFRQLEGMEIKDIVKECLQLEKKSIDDIVQVCKICYLPLKIEELNEHVEYCSKKSNINEKIEKISSEYLIALEQVKQLELELSSKSGRNSQEQLLLDIVNKITAKSKKKKNTINERKGARISSRIGLKRATSWIEQANDELSEYEVKYGENELVANCEKLEKQKQLLEKKLSIVETHYVNGNSMGSNKELSLHSKPSSDLSLAGSFDKLTEAKQEKKSNFCITERGKKVKPSQFETQAQQSSSESEELPSSNSSIQSIEEGLENFKVTQKKLTNKNHIEMSYRKADSQQEDGGYQIRVKNARRCNSVELNRDDLEEYEPISNSTTLLSFELLKFLGKGAYGRVYLARRILTNDLYALKMIKVKEKWGESEIKSVVNEHNIFKKIAGEHLVKAPFAFTEGQIPIFVLEYMPGGDLGKLMEEQVYLQESQAKFYLAEIVLAIEHLHNSDIIHRDLKPENLVFDNEGHLKLTDFGLSEIEINNKLTQAKDRKAEINCNVESNKKNRAARLGSNESVKLIGTPDYIAPEIISRASVNNKTIDWWSLGVMAYELIVGVRPFCGNSIDEIIDNIVKFKIEWPEIGYEDNMISPEAHDLISKLLNKNFMKRLGCEGAWEIKMHPFFKGIDWNNIKHEEPPIKLDIPNYEDLEESRQIKQEVMGIIAESTKHRANLKPLAIDKFVRYDLLKSETIKAADTRFNLLSDRVKRLEIAMKSCEKNREHRSQCRLASPTRYHCL